MASPFAEITALFVDDDPVQRLLMLTFLTKLGVKNILQASDGQEALDMLLSKKHVVHAIFTDYEMPVMNGVDFIKKLREHPELSHIGVAMISGNLTTRAAMKDEELELRAFLHDNQVLPFPTDNLSRDPLEEAIRDMTGL